MPATTGYEAAIRPTFSRGRSAVTSSGARTALTNYSEAAEMTGCPGADKAIY